MIFILIPTLSGSGGSTERRGLSWRGEGGGLIFILIPILSGSGGSAERQGLSWFPCFPPQHTKKGTLSSIACLEIKILFLSRPQLPNYKVSRSEEKDCRLSSFI